MNLLRLMRTGWQLLSILLSLQIASPALAERTLPTLIPSQQDQFVTTQGVKLHYVEGGEGTPVILLHGNDGSVQDFTMSVFDRIAAKHRTLAFDRPGHGKSDSLSYKSDGPEDQARVLHNALVQLGIKRPLIVAHSWSGSLALSYSLQFPNDLCGLVLLGAMAYETKEGAPKPIYHALKIPVVGTALTFGFKATGKPIVEKQLAQAFAPDPMPRDYANRFVEAMCKSSQLKAAARDEITVNPALRRMHVNYVTIKLPVVIMCGDHDLTVPPEKNSYPLHAAIKQSRLIVLPNAGHELQFTRPLEVLKAIDLAFQAGSALSGK